MYPIPPSEHLVEEKKCRQCSTPFPITDKDMEFYLKVSPVFPISPLCKEGAEGNEAGDFVSEVSRRNPPSLDTLGIPPLQRRYTIPPPTLCPDCRQQRRLAFRNERRLYKRKCDATGKDIVSIYSPDKPNRVYHQEYWWSDVWDPMSYGREFDFSRGAIEQMGKVYTDLPKVNLWIRLDMENCEYCNFGTNSKSCYMTTAPHHSQDCFNTNTPIYCTNDFDGIFNIQGNHLYECIHTTQCTNISYSRYCQICKNSSYLIDCVDCDDCFGCIGLHHKKYYFLNKKYSGEKYQRKKAGILSDRKLRDIFFRNFELLKNNSSYRNVRTINEEDSFGDGLANVSNSSHIFDCMSLESSKYSIISGGNSRNLYDSINGGLDSEYCLETISTINITNTHFSMLTYNSRDVHYSFHIEGCQNCFGCFGLRNKQYCILNKQYTKEEYESLVPRIIEKMMVTPLRHGFEGQMEWGEFFPASMSPFGYNETVANEYFPLTREEVLGKTSLIGEDVRRTGGVISEVNPPLSPLSGGSSNDTFLHGHHFNWSDYEAPFPKVEKVIPASKLPNEITKIPDDILNWAIECEVSGRPFRIIKQELAFYRKHNLPIPRRHPDVRHMDRMKMRNPRKLFERMCDCCGKDMMTTYAPERTETVYCEECYESEVLA